MHYQAETNTVAHVMSSAEPAKWRHLDDVDPVLLMNPADTMRAVQGAASQSITEQERRAQMEVHASRELGFVPVEPMVY